MESINYYRKIESMGIGLVLIEIKREGIRYGLKYHRLYNNGYKPPLDISFNSSDKLMEKFSFIIQNDKIFTNQIDIIIEKNSLPFNIPNEVDEKNYLHEEEGCFKINLFKNDLLLIKNEVAEGKYFGYNVDTDTILLFQNEEFCGVLIKNLKDTEIIKLKGF